MGLFSFASPPTTAIRLTDFSPSDRPQPCFFPVLLCGRFSRCSGFGPPCRDGNQTRFFWIVVFTVARRNISDAKKPRPSPDRSRGARILHLSTSNPRTLADINGHCILETRILQLGLCLYKPRPQRLVRRGAPPTRSHHHSHHRLHLHSHCRSHHHSSRPRKPLPHA